MKGRNITKNVLLAEEIVSDIRMRGKPYNVVNKLAIAKANDRVDWYFFLNFGKKGFDSMMTNMTWRLTIKNWYYVLINGQTHYFFHSLRRVK